MPEECQGGTEVARYQRPCEARSSDSPRRELFRQLAGSSNTAHGGWFAPLSLPLGPPSPLAQVSEPLGGVRPIRTPRPRRRRR